MKEAEALLEQGLSAVSTSHPEMRIEWGRDKCSVPRSPQHKYRCHPERVPARRDESKDLQLLLHLPFVP
jgi:hypothetical protein